MSPTVPVMLFTADDGLARRIPALAAPVVAVEAISDAARIRRLLQQYTYALLLLDIRGQAANDLLYDILESPARTLVVVIGPARSDPVIEALSRDIYGVLEPDVGATQLQLLLRQAIRHLDLMHTASVMQQPRERELVEAPAPRRAARDETQRLRQFLTPLRHFDDVESLLHGIVDSIAGAALVLRAGVFAVLDERQTYRLQAGVGCLDETRSLEFPPEAPLVRWLEISAQVVNRAALDHVREPAERLLLQRTLDTLGAELIVPLHGRGRMLGWLFLGRHATGSAFGEADIQDIMIFAEHVSTALENALLYRQIALQKSFAETMLRSLPMGIVAVSEEGIVYWFNESAANILALNRQDVMNEPAEVLGPRISGPLRACLAGMANETLDWFDSRTQQHLSLRTARIMDDSYCSGAVAFIADRTREQLLNKRQQEIERAAFWTDLAASMSHEIRNPMVAIKTFAQLLPEQYNDPEFRTEFSGLMSREVDRLDAIIQQINSFANRPQLQPDWISIREVLEEGRNLATLRVPAADMPINVRIDDAIPLVHADRRALTECFAHVFANAMEALYQKTEPRINVQAELQPSSNGFGDMVSVVIEDNAGGIPTGIRESVFSPFCTTKTRAMGLGLPIVQRTIADHNGQVTVETDGEGTRVKIALPVARREEDADT